MKTESLALISIMQKGLAVRDTPLTQTRILIRIVSHRLHLLGLDIVFEIHQWKVDDTYCNVLVVF